MAATPKRKHSTRRQGKRRSQLSVSSAQTVICPNCKKPKRAHFACPNCEK